MELKPCPFCGGCNIKIDAIPSVAQFYRCEKCKSKGPYWTADQGAKEKWNTRATDLLLKEMAEALQGMADIYYGRDNQPIAGAFAKRMDDVLRKYNEQEGE